MESTFKNGEIIECKVKNPEELCYLHDVLVRHNFTGTLKFEFTDPRGGELENKCMDMYEEFREEGKDPAKDREFLRLVCELSRLREPFAYYGPKEFHGLHHDGKIMPYHFADFHARALAEVVRNGQQDREHHSPTRPDKIINIYIVAYFCKIIKKNYFTTPYILNI